MELDAMTNSRNTAENDLELFRKLINKTNDAIFVADPRTGLFIFVNDKACASLGCERRELLKMGVMDIETTLPDNFLWQTHVNELRQKGALIFEGIHKRKNGDTFPVEANISYVVLNTTEYLVTVVRDITERKKMEEHLRSAAFFDDLTGLYNRRGFFTFAEEFLKLAKRQQQGLFMLYTDLDNLKLINDTLGHEEGDQALIDSANVIKETYRESDIVARIGGDEFAVIPIGTTGDNIEKLTGRLLDNIDNYNLTKKRNYSLSMSFGTSYYDPAAPCSVNQLIAYADKMMYEQKRLKKES
jgi:diguanylate cyclase (GGDEF)-like protein/PAS domain S-box-containing protein